LLQVAGWRCALFEVLGSKFLGSGDRARARRI
jgi:hypothetical protein